MKALGSAIRKGLVQACHDLSEGGLAVAAAEMSLAGLLGITIDVGVIPLAEMEQGDSMQGGGKPRPYYTKGGLHILCIVGAGLAPALEHAPDPSPWLDYNTILLFSESPSRFLVEVSPEHQDAFEAYMRTNGVRDLACIGVVNETEHFVIQNDEQVLIDLSVGELQIAWKGEQA